MSIDLATVERDGVAVVERVIQDDVLRSLIAALEEASDTSITRRGSVFARRNVLAIPDVRTFAEGEGRVLVEPVLGPGALPVRGLLFDKTRDANWTVPWHQDRSIAVRERFDVTGFGPWSIKAGVTHVQPPVDVLRDMLTLRLHLDDCGEGSGPLRVVRGSHERILDMSEVDQAVDSGEMLTCITLAGGAVLMRPLALHASSPAKRPGRRRVLHLEYAPASLSTLPGGLAWAFA